MVIFNSFLFVYQRVSGWKSFLSPLVRPLPPCTSVSKPITGGNWRSSSVAQGSGRVGTKTCFFWSHQDIWIWVKNWNQWWFTRFDEFDFFSPSIMEPSTFNKFLWHPMLTQCKCEDLGLSIDRYLAELSWHFGRASHSLISHTTIHLILVVTLNLSYSIVSPLFLVVHSYLCCIKGVLLLLPCLAFVIQNHNPVFGWKWCRLSLSPSFLARSSTGM